MSDTVLLSHQKQRLGGRQIDHVYPGIFPTRARVSLQLPDSDINRARDELQAARRRMGGYRPLCMDHPQLFDPQDGERGESYVEYTRRSAVAALMCITSCRVFRQCQELARVDRKISGTVAGITREYEDDGEAG